MKKMTARKPTALKPTALAAVSGGLTSKSLPGTLPSTGEDRDKIISGTVQRP